VGLCVVLFDSWQSSTVTWWRAGGCLTRDILSTITAEAKPRYTGVALDVTDWWRPTRVDVPTTGVSPRHMPLSAHARGITPTTAKPHSPEPRPTTPDTADRSTAWMRLAAPVATAWHRRVALGVLTLRQNAYRGETLDIYEVET
jgi:hypothetical protein